MDQHKIQPYKTVNRGKPVIRKEIDISAPETETQLKRDMLFILW